MGGGGGGNSFNDAMTWETRSVLIDRMSKKISPSFICAYNSLGIACKSAFSLCFQIYAWQKMCGICNWNGESYM